MIQCEQKKMLYFLHTLYNILRVYAHLPLIRTFFLPAGLEEDREGEEEGDVLPLEEICYQGLGMIVFALGNFASDFKY